VGSEEGWTPSTFSSSSKSRKTDPLPQQSMYDFMDEEDGILGKVRCFFGYSKNVCFYNRD